MSRFHAVGRLAVIVAGPAGDLHRHRPSGPHAASSGSKAQSS
jgi:hypothetical protein